MKFLLTMSTETIILLSGSISEMIKNYSNKNEYALLDNGLGMTHQIVLLSICSPG
jgi:hypothetical protein